MKYKRYNPTTNSFEDDPDSSLWQEWLLEKFGAIEKPPFLPFYVPSCLWDLFFPMALLLIGVAIGLAINH